MPTRSFNRQSFHRKPRSYGGQRPFARARRGKAGAFSDLSKFVHKAVITETAEHFTPEHAFNDFAIDARIKKNIAAKGYIIPTPIQDKVIPHVLRGSDVVGIANTGTGKTAAFLLPLIDRILRNPRQNVLIVVPTRELAVQIDEEFRAFTRGLGIHAVVCIGGAGIGPQIHGLRRPYNVVIGTPGRLKDLINRKLIDRARFKTIVLDEADRMLDMGFINDVKMLMAGMPATRQTLFFSATISRDIQGLIHQFLREPVSISVKTQDTSENVDQDVIKTNGSNKIEILHDLLKRAEFNKVLVFGRTKHGVEKLSVVLAQRGLKVESIHGNKNHSKRQRALGMFKDNRIQVLVATDLAARGLDIADISHVINFDLPASYDDYIHRIGRTGRGSKKGKALTFVD